MENLHYFDPGTLKKRKYQVNLGESAYLTCSLRASPSFQVQNQHHQHQYHNQNEYLNQRQRDSLIVSWIRSKNNEILTSGELRQTSDERFRATHLPNSQDWTLEIRNSQEEDAGPYECQVNSEPRPARLSVQLEILRPQMEINVMTSTPTSVSILDETPDEMDNYPSSNHANRNQTSKSNQNQLLRLTREGSQMQLTCKLQFHKIQPKQNGMGAKSVHNLEKKVTSGRRRLHNANTTYIPDNVDSPIANTNTAGERGQIHEMDEMIRYYIYWYRDGVNLQYGAGQRASPNRVQFERRVTWNSRLRFIESKLKIESAQTQDSGLYTCKVLPELVALAYPEARVLVLGSSSSGSAASGFLWARFSASSNGAGIRHALGSWNHFLILLTTSFLAAKSGPRLPVLAA